MEDKIVKKKITVGIVFGLLLSNAICVFGMKKEDKALKRLKRRYKNEFDTDSMFKGIKNPKYKKLRGKIIMDPDYYKKPNKDLNIVMRQYIPLSAYSDWADAAMFLIQNGADLNYKDEIKNKRPIDYAVEALSFSTSTKSIKEAKMVKNSLNILYVLTRKKPKITDKARKKFEATYPKIEKYLKDPKNKLQSKIEMSKLKKISNFFKGIKDKQDKEIREKDFEKRFRFVLDEE